MIRETLELCKKCRERQKSRHPETVACAFLHDGMYCDRLDDIDSLLKKLLYDDFGYLDYVSVDIWQRAHPREPNTRFCDYIKKEFEVN